MSRIPTEPSKPQPVARLDPVAQACPWSMLGHRFDVVDSTMTQARALAAQGAPHGTWVLARAQSQGRGRRGRSWLSEAAAGVYMTLVLRPGAARSLEGLPLVFGLAARNAICATLAAQGVAEAETHIGVKWPNDIVSQNRKIGGILVEAESVGTADCVLRVGIGLNVAPAQSLPLTPDIAARYLGVMQLWQQAQARSCVEHIGGAPGEPTASMWVEALSQALLSACHVGFAAWSAAGLGPTLAAFAAVDALAGRTVWAQQGAQRICGTARGLSACGRLRLECGRRIVLVDSGEVHTDTHRPENSADSTRLGAAVYVGLTLERR